MSDAVENASVVETPEIPEVKAEAIVSPQQVVLVPNKVTLANSMVNTAQTMVCGMVLTGIANLALTGAKAAWKGGKQLLAKHKEKKELKAVAKKVAAQEEAEEPTQESEE
jgi:hypothetical protein